MNAAERVGPADAVPPSAPLRPLGSRRLAGLVALAAGAAVGIHHVAPGQPFPLAEGWAAAGAAVAAVLALPVPLPAAARRVGAIACAGLLLHAGLPADHHATFPFVELDRARIPEWGDLTSLALFGLLAVAGAVATTGVDRLLSRLLALVSVAALAASLVLPVKASFQELAPAAPGMTTIPVLGWAAPAPRRWTRSFTTGPVVTLLPSFVRDEWAVMDIAGGIHQEADRAALARGEKSKLVVQVHAGVRYVLWRALQGVAALVWGLRLLAVPAGLVVIGGLFAGRGVPGGGVARGLVRAAVYLVPAANLVALGVSTIGLLPDDLGLRPAAFASTLTTLVLCRLVETSGEGT